MFEQKISWGCSQVGTELVMLMSISHIGVYHFRWLFSEPLGKPGREALQPFAR